MKRITNQNNHVFVLNVGENRDLFHVVSNQLAFYWCLKVEVFQIDPGLLEMTMFIFPECALV